MISIEPYDIKYLQDIDSWLHKREMKVPLNDIPKIGFVALLKGTPIAAGFLRQCEGGHGILDSFVTDPEAPANDRHIAMDMLTNQLVTSARDIDLTQLICFTIDENTLLRAQRHGLVSTPWTMLAMRLLTPGKGV